MKRRGFLTLLGAALTAPALPGATPALGARLKALGAAHARKFPMVSVMGITRRLDLSPEEAQELFSYLVRKGLIGSPNVPGTGLANAASRVFRPTPARMSVATKAAQEARRKPAAAEPHAPAMPKTPTRTWLHHLHDICIREGLTLCPRAQAMVS